MTRLGGIVAGSLLTAVAFALLLNGHVTDNRVHADRPARHIDAGLQQVQAEAGTATAAVTADIDADAGPAETAVPPSAERLAITPQTWNRATASYVVSQQPAPGPLQQAVWQPFRSQWAADGFVSRLTLATGVPLEVIQEAPDVYQVVFRYRDETERRAQLQHIEAVTGLEVQP